MFICVWVICDMILDVQLQDHMENRGPPPIVDFDSSMHTSVPILRNVGAGTKVLTSEDGSSSQFIRGKDGQFVVQQLNAQTGCYHTHVRCEAQAGKGPSDGAMLSIISAVKREIQNGFNPDSGARGLTQLMAYTRRRPRVPRSAKTAFHSHTNLVYGFFPDDAFESVKAETGIAGSNSIHFVQSHAANTSTDDSWVTYRKRPCPCDECLAGNFSKCLVPELIPDNGLRTIQLSTKKTQNRRGTATRAATVDYVAKIKLGTKVAVRVHRGDYNEHGEAYYLAIVFAANGDRHSWKNPKTQRFGSNLVKKGVHLLRLRWLHYQPDAPILMDDPESRAYTTVPNEATAVFPASATIMSAFDSVQLLRRDGENKVYRLPSSAHEEIIAEEIDLLSHE